MRQDPVQGMLATIDDAFARTAYRTGLEAPDPRVRAAMARVPRDRFVPAGIASRSWDDSALSIGHGQTISQPYIVALMSSLVQPEPHHRVLEIGTGSGYQAAVLAEIVRGVFTIEVIPDLGARSEATLRALGYENVHVRVGDGAAGWPEQAPYDGILVTCGGAAIPPALIGQLAPGGHLVMPVGAADEQRLLDVTVGADGGVRRRDVLGVRFVPFVHG